MPGSCQVVARQRRGSVLRFCLRHLPGKRRLPSFQTCHREQAAQGMQGDLRVRGERLVAIAIWILALSMGGGPPRGEPPGPVNVRRPGAFAGGGGFSGPTPPGKGLGAALQRPRAGKAWTRWGAARPRCPRPGAGLGRPRPRASHSGAPSAPPAGGAPTRCRCGLICIGKNGLEKNSRRRLDGDTGGTPRIPSGEGRLAFRPGRSSLAGR